MRTAEEYLVAVLAEIKALRETVVAKRYSVRAPAARGVKPSTLAADLGCHPRTITRAIKDGRIEAIPCGKSWSISRREAERVKTHGIGARHDQGETP